ncbi:MAG TPA: bifunctional pantoate--beta-alanine ligase/(d)CMP kinase, partial [Chroococcidiopsis sp.]
MRLFTTVAGLRCHLERIKVQGQPGEGKDDSAPDAPLSVGLVPTMGALHDGHLSLMRRARQENDVVVVSIFVNPLQFGPNEDFRRYPRSLEHDQALCEAVGVDVIFAPTAAEFYQAESYQDGGDSAAPQGSDSPTPDRITQVIPPAAMMTRLCGRTRPGHFQGVATVVTKLLNAVQPQRAYFGQKDAQQLAIIKRIAADLNLPVEICPCPIVREPSGLALSSRNQYLSDEERSQATALYRGLKQAERLFRQGVLDADRLISAVTAELAALPTLQIDYVELVHPTTLQPLDGVHEAGLLAIAAYVGSTRLIDNIVLRNRKPIIAIDGPAGAGKSTVVRQVAQQLGLLYLDTGAMYRAVTWLALEAGIALDDEAAIAELVSQCKIDISGLPTESSIAINDQDVTRAIR